MIEREDMDTLQLRLSSSKLVEANLLSLLAGDEDNLSIGRVLR